MNKVLDLLGGQQNLALGRRIPDRIRQQVVQDGAQCSPVGLDHSQIGVGAHLDPNALLGSLVAEAVAGLAQGLERAQPLELQFALAGIQFGHFDEVGHQIVQFL